MRITDLVAPTKNQAESDSSQVLFSFLINQYLNVIATLRWFPYRTKFKELWY